jgi:hypothetical protein
MSSANNFLRGSVLALWLVLVITSQFGCSRITGQNSGQKKPTDIDRTFEPFLAHDSKSGEYLGVVISECRDWETKKVTSYKVRLKDGTAVEKSPDSITIDPP